MKTVQNIIYGLIILILFSCNYQHDKKAHERLIKSLVQVNEKINSDINFLQESIINNKTKIAFLMYDPTFREQVMEIEPKLLNLEHLTNNLDDLLLVKMNELIEKEENESDWFTIQLHQRKVFYKDFNKLNHKDGSAWTTKLYGTNTKEAITNSHLIKTSIIEYRNKTILAFADEMKNYKNEEIYITNGDLVSYEYLDSHLIKIRHPWRDDLLNIYSKLSFPTNINDSGVAKKWNIYTFNNQPLIGVISTFNFLRKDIKEAQNIAGDILVNSVIK